MTEEREQGGAQPEEFSSEVQETPQSTAPPPHEKRAEGRYERKYSDRGHGGDRGYRDGGRPDRRPGRYRPTGEGSFERTEDDPRLNELIRETEQKLQDSTQPVQMANLNAFERKQIHRHFELRKPAFETKTYRGDGDSYVLWVFPIANLKKLAEEKAQEAIAKDSDVALPPMSNYERFVVHSVLQTIESIESVSVGEGAERHIEIQPKKFGRGLKKIIKKIKLM